MPYIIETLMGIQGPREGRYDDMVGGGTEPVSDTPLGRGLWTAPVKGDCSRMAPVWVGKRTLAAHPRSLALCCGAG